MLLDTGWKLFRNLAGGVVVVVVAANSSFHGTDGEENFVSLNIPGGKPPGVCSSPHPAESVEPRGICH